eukprot:9464683-Alexandrium_andersonii.AAC.1
MAPPKAAGQCLSAPPRDGAQGEWEVARPKGAAKHAAGGRKRASFGDGASGRSGFARPGAQ